jgi:hypothetical protein
MTILSEFQAKMRAAVSRMPTLQDISTCELQRELSRREGVQVIFLGPDDMITKTVLGPAWLVVNRD